MSNHEFRLKKIYETRNYLIEEIKHDLMCGKYKKTYKQLNYVEHLVILASTISSCVSTFTSLICVPVGITIGLKICEITVSVNNVLREYNQIKQEIKILKLLWNTLYKYGSYKHKNV